ncbi:hypothetical protein LCGC14_2308170 [marine sediment metagenome]|uniref:Uncharacterized protein n=1 Tax=marine sediment metagenome TaxID=412755 RepID=A0A0F9EYR8_9ZZZZ
MSKRYLKISSGIIWATDNLTKEDLVRMKTGAYDHILDLEKWLRYNSKTNVWDPIEGDE